MSNYEDRRQRRIERYERLAEKNREQSESRYEQAGRIQSFIPLGQPILVGHHSEKRHRRDLEKIDNHYRKSYECQKKAEYYEQRAHAAERNTAIFADDPEALDKLQNKLTKLRETQEFMKNVNRVHAMFVKAPDSENTRRHLACFTAEEQEQIKTYTPRYSWEPHPFPPYMLSNNNAEIKRAEKRIKELEARQGQETTETITKGVRVVENVEDNRIQLFFPGMPSVETRTALKRNGFKWARSIGAWQRHLNNAGRYAAKYVLENYSGEDC